MGWMLPAVFLLAGVAWVVAMISAVAIVRLAKPGTGFSTMQRIGRWDFDGLTKDIGPAAIPHIKRYQLAFLGFFIAILGFMAVGITLAIQSDPRFSTP